jgi:hypothetical protein
VEQVQVVVEIKAEREVQERQDTTFRKQVIHYHRMLARH